MLKILPKRLIAMPTEAENRKIRRAARIDPDATLLTEAQLKAMLPLKSIRGRPKSESKKLLVSVRYSPEVLTYFRSTGEGWQGRMDGVLQEYVVEQSSQSAKRAG